MEGVRTKILSRATLYIILKKYRVVPRLHRGQTSEALFQVRSIEFSTKRNSTFISRKSQRWLNYIFAHFSITRDYSFFFFLYRRH